MTFSPELIVSPEARRDLRSILRYTERKWGSSQRDDYADRIVTAMNDLATFPELGATRDDISMGLRARSVGHHLILYRLQGSTVNITRILHENMDISALAES